jgi:hypothetical protein
MTLGRTSDNKLKIKTDGEAGLRAVSCGCCGGCSFDAFSPTLTPIEGAQKFKYLTLESTSIYSIGGLNAGLPSYDVECAPYEYENEDGETETGVTCGAFSAIQRSATRSLTYKATFYTTLGTEDWEPCVCEVVKAEGSDSGSYYEHFGVTYAEEWGDISFFQYSRTVADAVWETEEIEGVIYLIEKTSPAIFENSFCESGRWDWDCRNFPLTCFDLDGSNYPTNEDSYTYSEPLESGGFKVRERTIVESLQTYSGSGAFGAPATYANSSHTYRFTLHDTLKEIWGPDQPEMRP